MLPDEEKKKKRAEYMKVYWAKNKEKIIKYRKTHKQKRTPEQRESNLEYQRKRYQKARAENPNFLLEKNREWRANNLEKARKLSLTYKNNARDRTKEFVDFVKQWCGCADCGVKNYHVLHFHHLDPKKKAYSLAKMVGNGLSISRVKEELKKGIFVCANCHIMRHVKNGVLNYNDKDLI